MEGAAVSKAAEAKIMRNKALPPMPTGKPPPAPVALSAPLPIGPKNRPASSSTDVGGSHVINTVPE